MSFFFPSKKFKEPLNTAVYTTVHVMKEESPIILVSHELDGDWQFLGSEPLSDYASVSMLVGLGEIIALDKSVLKVADLPPGYQASRKRRIDNWIIEKINYSEQEMNEFGYYCAKCGLYHSELPMAYGKDAPDKYYLMSESEQQDHCELGDSQCIIEDKLFYVRGVIELAVEGNPEKFLWNVWVSVSEDDYVRMEELWEDENRILEKPYEGKLATQVEVYPNMLDLPVAVINRKVGLVPLIELRETNHPLFLEQEAGINMERVQEFSSKILYQH